MNLKPIKEGNSRLTKYYVTNAVFGDLRNTTVPVLLVPVTEDYSTPRPVLTRENDDGVTNPNDVRVPLAPERTYESAS